MAEQWKPIPGYEGLYEISDMGRVLSVRRQQLLKPSAGNDGYLKLKLRGKNQRVHRLVLLAFVGPCPEGMATRHLNGRRGDNRLANLEWADHATNIRDKRRHADPAAHPPTHCPQGHEWTEDNTYNAVRPDGHRERHCRKCRRDRWRERNGKTGRVNATRYNPERKR